MAHEVIEARRPPSVKLLEQLKRLTDFCKPAEGANATWRARTNESRLRSCESNVNICYKLAKQVQQEMELATQCAELVVPLGPCLLIQLPSLDEKMQSKKRGSADLAAFASDKKARPSIGVLS